jgi:pyruvate dehydrogenase E1 component beta subunit
MREALRAALREEMARDDRVFIMGEEVGEWQGTHRVTRGLLEEFGPRRVRDTPISEMVIAGAAVGAAMAGLRPVAEMMTINFAFLAFDAIINHAAKIHYMFDGQFTVPLVIRAATGWGNQATATHSHFPEPIFAHFPGLYVASPSTAYDAKGMLKAAIRDDNPVLFTESIALYPKPGIVPDDPDFVLPIGKSDVKREGDDVTIVSFARGVDWSLAAAEELAKEGIECEVVDLRWLRPLDLQGVFESFRKTNRCVVVEESLPHFGIASEIAAQIQENVFDYMDAPVKRVSAMDVPLPYAAEIELMALPSAQKVVDAVKEVL